MPVDNFVFTFEKKFNILNRNVNILPYSGSEDESDEEVSDDNNQRPIDEALQQAQAAARAKQLRAKFEKWEQDEIKREQEQERLYDGEDQSQIDTRW